MLCWKDESSSPFDIVRVRVRLSFWCFAPVCGHVGCIAVFLDSGLEILYRTGNPLYGVSVLARGMGLRFAKRRGFFPIPGKLAP